jgi:hypothetical protein
MTAHWHGRKQNKVDPIERRELDLALHEDDGNLIDDAGLTHRGSEWSRIDHADVRGTPRPGTESTPVL